MPVILRFEGDHWGAHVHADLPWRGRNAAGFWISARPGPLADLAGDTFSLGFSGAGEAMRALT